jgi:putative transcriptional regulator
MNAMFDIGSSKNFNSLAGKFLIANPYMNFNEVFNKSVIYLASHSENGAIGLIVNHLVNTMPYKSIFKMLKAETDVENINIPVYLGGPVEPDRGFVLHSGEYNKNLLFKFEDNLAVSSNLQILQDMAHGIGPKNSLFVMGYTGWAPGQLEHELEQNHWIISEADLEILFSNNNDNKWNGALDRLGIDSSFYSSQLGHC